MSNTVKSRIPENHLGIHYWDLLDQLTAKRRVKRYLEIGVQEGCLMSRINAEHAVGVDPFFNIRFNVAAKKRSISLFQGTSDEFFGRGDNVKLIGGSPDFVFLDGMHTFEYLLRDFYNTERISSKSTLIAVHDCLPLNDAMIDRDEERSIERGKSTSFPNYWTGDVWKFVLALMEYRRDVKIIAADSAPTGMVFVTNLDPESQVLSENYLDICQKYIKLPNDADGLGVLYSSIEIVDVSRIVNQFDNSLFFRM